jgi:hypothetical protein
MVLINSIFVLPRHSNRVGIIIYDNPQAQEIIRLNGLECNTIYTIKDTILRDGFRYEHEGKNGINKWYLNTKDTSYKTILFYNDKYSTTYYLDRLKHYKECPRCLAAMPESWIKCIHCS